MWKYAGEYTIERNKQKIGKQAKEKKNTFEVGHKIVRVI